jgi:hypothetical protein
VPLKYPPVSAMSQGRLARAPLASRAASAIAAPTAGDELVVAAVCTHLDGERHDVIEREVVTAAAVDTAVIVATVDALP